MKLTDCKTFVVANPPPHFGGPYFVFVKLSTDTGVEGIGEAYCVPFGPHVVASMIEDVFERYALNEDPFKIEKLWRRVYSSAYTQHPDLSLMGVLSAIEMACWDIVGKDVGKPVYELLGGQVHEKLRSYTYLYSKDDDPVDVYTDPDLGAERAASVAAQGFTAVKFDPAGPYTSYDPRQLSLEALNNAEEYTRKVREAVGPNVDLLFGTHGQMTTSSAIRLAKRLEPFDPLWFEEPTGTENELEMARIAQHTSIPIATGERLTTKYDFASILQAQAASILQMNLGRVGGILEAKKIAGIAETHYAQIAPHLYCGPVVGAANIQISTCSPNFLILESIQKWDNFHADILKTPITWEDGYVIPPTTPGLGVELNEEVALANPYNGNARHLNPQEEPLA